MGNKVTTKTDASKELTAKEIQNMHANFLRDYPSGRMDKGGLVKFSKQLMPNQKNMEAISNRAFATFDQNHDGTIDFREFILTIAANTTNDLDTRLKIVFETCDISGHGHMDLGELIKFFKTALNLAGSPELANDETVTPLASNVFDVLGVTQTGKINQEQFIRGCKREPALQELFGAKT